MPVAPQIKGRKLTFFLKQGMKFRTEEKVNLISLEETNAHLLRINPREKEVFEYRYSQPFVSVGSASMNSSSH